MKPKVEPLKRRTMTLDELQQRTIKAIRQMQKQLKRKHYHGGMTDDEFSDQVLNALANDILMDREILKMAGYRHPCNLCGQRPSDA